MTKIQTHLCSVLALLAVFYISTADSLAQEATKPSLPSGSSGGMVQTQLDPFAVLPESDALMVLDLKRFNSEVIARLLSDEPAARALVIALADPGKVELVDPRTVQRIVVGFRYLNSADEKRPNAFAAITVAETSEAGQLATLIRNRGAGKYREERYAGKLLYITHLEQADLKGAPPPLTNSDETEWAIVALEANTLVFGNPKYVRASIDVNTGKGTTVSAELVTAVKRNSKAMLSAAGLLPTSLLSAGQQLVNSELSQMLSSLKRFNASIEVIPTGVEVAVALNTTSPEQNKSLVDLLVAFKTLIVSLAPGKTRQDKAMRDFFKGVVISGGETEVRIKNEIAQQGVNDLAKQYAAAMYFARGLAQGQKGDSDAEIAEYDKAILLDPEAANTFINRGKARTNKGSFDAAIADYDKAISLAPDSALAYNNRCFVRVNKEDFEAAIGDCDKAIALDPTFAFAYNNRGLAFTSQGKLDKAMPDYDKSIALDAENIFAYQNRGNARLEMENWDGAIADFEKAISINGKSPEAYNGRGVAHYAIGELELALADYNKALALNPNLAEAYGNRALCLLELRKDAQAEQDLKKCYELNGKLRSVFEPAVIEIKKARRAKPRVDY